MLKKEVKLTNLDRTVQDKVYILDLGILKLMTFKQMRKEKENNGDRIKEYEMEGGREREKGQLC